MKNSDRNARILSLRARASLDVLAIEGLEARCLFGVGPSIGAIHAPTQPVAPGTNLNVTFEDVTAPEGAEVSGITLVRDVNANGVHDAGDLVLGNAVPDPTTPGRWTFDQIVEDTVATGDAAILAVPTDTYHDQGEPVAFGVSFAYRIFYPEGWRNDTTINEYVPMVNPNPFPVDYRVLARYEVGDRDEVIAEGTLPALSRGGITISERSNPGNALVRLNEGYALEIQSSAYIGATLSHYDSFTGSGGVGAAVGEAFTSTTSHEWFFANASNSNADFILFYNPFDQPLPLSVTFYDEAQNAHTFEWNVEPLRRSGIALSNPALNLPANNNFGIFITAPGNQQFVAALSSYSTVTDAGYTGLGQRLGVTVFPLVEFRDTTDNTLFVFNPSMVPISVTVRSVFIGSASGPTTVVHTVNPREHLNIDVDAGRPMDAEGVALRVTGGYVQVESVDLTRGDSLLASAASTAQTVWAFGDGFLDSNTAGTVGFESLGLYNTSNAAQNVQIRYLFTDGTFADRTINIAANSAARVQLDQDQLILQHAQLNFYSVMVYGQSPLIATFTHWDLFQGGGWASLGTPGGTAGPA